MGVPGTDNYGRLDQVAFAIDTFVGPALTSHDNRTLATGVFDGLTVVR
jgi:hypothetical protein